MSYLRAVLFAILLVGSDEVNVVFLFHLCIDYEASFTFMCNLLVHIEISIVASSVILVIQLVCFSGCDDSDL